MPLNWVSHLPFPVTSPSVTAETGARPAPPPIRHHLKGHILTPEVATALVLPRLGRRGRGEMVIHGNLNPGDA